MKNVKETITEIAKELKDLNKEDRAQVKGYIACLRMQTEEKDKEPEKVG